MFLQHRIPSFKAAYTCPPSYDTTIVQNLHLTVTVCTIHAASDRYNLRSERIREKLSIKHLSQEQSTRDVDVQNDVRRSDNCYQISGNFPSLINFKRTKAINRDVSVLVFLLPFLWRASNGCDLRSVLQSQLSFH